MKNILLISQMVVSVLLIILILTQNKEGGMGAMMGGGAQSFRATRRGAEKVIFVATILLAVLFLVNALLFAFI